jgi:hypothetical protein
MIKVCIQIIILIDFILFEIGTFLYKLPSSELREKSNRFILKKTSDAKSIDPTAFLTSPVKDIKHQEN